MHNRKNKKGKSSKHYYIINRNKVSTFTLQDCINKYHLKYGRHIIELF